jgi:hypothetical protein
VESDFPAPGGDPHDRNRFVVLHDTVPGGTGYLPRLADPNELRGILSRARDLITTCECQTRGKPGCHKCLYGGIDRHELPRVSRVVALELLDEILTEWKLLRAAEGTITGVNLSPVVQSELERMFKVLLQRWSDGAAARLTSRPDPDHAARTRFDLRFQDGPHWEIREQVNLSQHHTIPDFYATRVDAPGTAPVAIYLDGWQYHGQVATQVDHDARRRASLRASGIGVWTLTWSDVKSALAAANGDGSVGSATPLAGPARNHAAKGIADQLGAEHGLAGVLKLGAFEQLMARLRDSAPEAWAQVAMMVALAPVSGGVAVDVATASAAIARVAGGDLPEPSPIPTDIRAATWESSSGLWAHAILDAAASPDHPCTAVLSLDTSTDVSQDQWADWLHLGNIIAGLGTDAVITTTGSYAGGQPPAPVMPATGAVPSSADVLLEDCYDDDARQLGTAAVAAGHSKLVVGYETDWPEGTLIEIAWPDRKVGILPAGEDVPGNGHGWTLLPAATTAEAELLAALEPVGS